MTDYAVRLQIVQKGLDKIDLLRTISRSTNGNYCHRPRRADRQGVRRREAGRGRVRNVALYGQCDALVARGLEDVALALAGALAAVVADNRAGCPIEGRGGDFAVASRELGDDFHGLPFLDNRSGAPQLCTRGRRPASIAPRDVICSSDQERSGVLTTLATRA